MEIINGYSSLNNNGFKTLTIAIDGPAGTGKSTTAKLLAKKLNYTYIDSGAFYRAITLNVLQNNIKVDETDKIIEIAKASEIDIKEDEYFLNGTNVSKEIRSLEVTNKVSAISKIKELRSIVVDKLKNFSKDNDVIMDGRDIGTVVFPDADFKFFLVCDIKTRAARRQQDFRDMGFEIPIERIVKELQLRDEIDTKREIAPLRKASDAIEVDTTNMIIEEQVNYIYRKIFPVDEN